MGRVKKFNSSPESIDLEKSFKRSVLLSDSEGWGRERFVEELRRVANFHWQVSELEGGLIMVDGPKWWRERVLKSGVARLGGQEIRAKAWDGSLGNGRRLKSTWILIQGFPMKFWQRIEFEKLIEDFGILFEIDQATIDRTSFKEAKLRIGVSSHAAIPMQQEIFFRSESGQWCWDIVRFIIDQPGGGVEGGLKRKRVWTRRSDQAREDPQPSEPPIDQDGDNDEEFEDEDLVDYGDEDLLEDKEGGVQEVESVIVEIEMEAAPTKLNSDQIVGASEGLDDEINQMALIVTQTAEEVLNPEIEELSMELTADVEKALVAEDNRRVLMVVADTDPVQTTAEMEGDDAAQLFGVKATTTALSVVVEKAVPIQQMLPEMRTRQSLRQKLLEPEKKIQDKAIQRKQVINLEKQGNSKNSLPDFFPFAEIDDS